MQARSLCTVVIGLASTAMFACASGEIDDGGGTFTTGNTTNNDTLDATRGDTGEEGEEHDTGHPEEEGETGEPEPDPTCDDGEQNQDETDVDCGGATCAGCGDGQACSGDSDCAMQSCVGGLCIVPTCTDGVANGDETDVDCGGSCGACGDGQACVGPSDCTSGVCAGSFCAAPNCGDSVQNGNETDLDCGGGGNCSGCAEGGSCNGDTDCLSQYCLNGSCAPADCSTDADCSEFNSQCTTGVCNANHTCDAVAANNGNGCDDGDLCSNGETCNAGSCGGGAPLDCSGMSNACNLGVCNPQDGACTVQPANNGNPCNDNNACTVSEVCSAGQCADPNAPGYVLYEDFNDNSAGWALGPEWQIGGAAATAGCNSCPGNDPSTDHTSTNDNGIAGVLIGVCTNNTVHGDYCLTSPAMNTANLATVWLTYWRHLHSDFSPYMVSQVQVFNGVNWNQVWATGNLDCTNDAAWTQMAHNITAYKATNMQVRFCFSIGSTGVFSSGSWNLDDIVVGPAQCNP